MFGIANDFRQTGYSKLLHRHYAGCSIVRDISIAADNFDHVCGCRLFVEHNVNAEIGHNPAFISK